MFFLISFRYNRFSSHRVVDYFKRIEFQQRSVHMCTFFLVEKWFEGTVKWKYVRLPITDWYIIFCRSREHWTRTRPDIQILIHVLQANKRRGEENILSGRLRVRRFYFLVPWMTSDAKRWKITILRFTILVVKTIKIYVASLLVYSKTNCEWWEIFVVIWSIC